MNVNRKFCKAAFYSWRHTQYAKLLLIEKWSSDLSHLKHVSRVEFNLYLAKSYSVKADFYLKRHFERLAMRVK